jgi:hypothetical protein
MEHQPGYLVLSRALFAWGCAGGAIVGVLAALVWTNGVRPDAAELRDLALLIGFEISALSVCLSVLIRVIGNAGRRSNHVPVTRSGRFSELA